MDPIKAAELEAEYNAKFDYIAELEAEHADPFWDYEPEVDEDVEDAGEWVDIEY
jgi:hypothetical protein